MVHLTCENRSCIYVVIGQLSAGSYTPRPIKFSAEQMMEHERQLEAFRCMKLPLLLYAQLFIVKEMDGFLMRTTMPCGK